MAHVRAQLRRQGATAACRDGAKHFAVGFRAGDSAGGDHKRIRVRTSCEQRTKSSWLVLDWIATTKAALDLLLQQLLTHWIMDKTKATCSALIERVRLSPGLLPALLLHKGLYSRLFVVAVLVKHGATSSRRLTGRQPDKDFRL